MQDRIIELARQPERPKFGAERDHGVSRRRRLIRVPPGGYFGRALVVDASDGSSEVLPLPDELLRAYIGGAGLGAWLLHQLSPAGVDPLGKAAPLAAK